MPYKVESKCQTQKSGADRYGLSALCLMNMSGIPTGCLSIFREFFLGASSYYHLHFQARHSTIPRSC